MNKIIAKGKKLNRDFEIIAYKKNGKIELEIETEKILKIFILKDFNYYKKEQPPMGGTYYPPTESLMSAYNVFMNTDFFQNEPKIEIIGEIGEMPCKEDRVY